MNNIVGQWLPAKEVMEKVHNKEEVRVYVGSNIWAIIDNAYVIEHSGYIRFWIYHKECGKNTISALPDQTIEVSLENPKDF